MRVFEKIKIDEEVIVEVICNQCGKKMGVEEGILKEGCFHADYSFDYFSNKDGYKFSFDLCEECFDHWITGFKHPAEICEVKEYL